MKASTPWQVNRLYTLTPSNVQAMPKAFPLSSPQQATSCVPLYREFMVMDG